MRARTPQPVALVSDNCGAHEELECDKVKGIPLPPNCTSIYQPLGLGNSFCLKRRYKRRLLDLVVRAFEASQGVRLAVGSARGGKGGASATGSANAACGGTPHTNSSAGADDGENAHAAVSAAPDGGEGSNLTAGSARGGGGGRTRGGFGERGQWGGRTRRHLCEDGRWRGATLGRFGGRADPTVKCVRTGRSRFGGGWGGLRGRDGR